MGNAMDKQEAERREAQMAQRQEALRIIVEASLKYPHLGWDEANKLADFQGKIMKRPGATYNNFAEALVPLGLTREEAKDAFVDARARLRASKEEPKRATRAAGAGAKPAGQPVREERRAVSRTVVCPRPDAPPLQRDHRPAPDLPPEPQRVDSNQSGTGKDTGPSSGRPLRGEAAKPQSSRSVPGKSSGVKRKPADTEPDTTQPTLF